MTGTLGRVRWSLHNQPGVPCGECRSGWPRGRRAQKRREQRQWRREADLEWRPEPGQPGENGGDRAGLAGCGSFAVPSVAPVSVLDTEGGRAFLKQLLRNDPTPLTVDAVRRVLADTGSRYTFDEIAAEFNRWQEVSKLAWPTPAGVLGDHQAQGRVPGRDELPSPAGDTTTT